MAGQETREAKRAPLRRIPEDRLALSIHAFGVQKRAIKRLSWGVADGVCGLLLAVEVRQGIAVTWDVSFCLCREGGRVFIRLLLTGCEWMS